VYVRPTIEGEAASFGVSGKLWRNTLIMYDRPTRSLWSQVQGRAVAGPKDGETLEEIPAQVTTWAEWWERHPETLVLVKPPLEEAPYGFYYDAPAWVNRFLSRGRDRRLPPQSLVLGLEGGERRAAVPLTALDRQPVLHAEALGRPIVVFSPPSAETAALVYDRTVGGRVLEFEAVGEGTDDLELRDRHTGSRWSWESGECTAGELAGARLTPLAAKVVYWSFWSRHHPDTELVGVAP